MSDPASNAREPRDGETGLLFRLRPEERRTEYTHIYTQTHRQRERAWQRVPVRRARKGREGGFSLHDADTRAWMSMG